MSNSYIEKNRWFITASKVKLLNVSQEAYYKVYEQEIDTSFVKQSDSLEKWTKVDQYILTREIFNKNYATPVWRWTVKELKEECNRLWIPFTPKDKKPDLEAKLYWNRSVVTAWDYEMLQWIDSELRRQPLFDYDWDYECQKIIECEYKGLKLRWTIDRFSLEKWLIRDLKTSKDVELSKYHWITKFHNSLITSDEYQYWFQLAWYWLLCTTKYKKDFDCIIDWVKATYPYSSEFLKFDKDMIKQIVNDDIIPALNKLVECYKTWDWTDKNIDRNTLLSNWYYPVLDAWIQKDFTILEV